MKSFLSGDCAAVHALWPAASPRAAALGEQHADPAPAAAQVYRLGKDLDLQRLAATAEMRILQQVLLSARHAAPGPVQQQRLPESGECLAAASPAGQPSVGVRGACCCTEAPGGALRRPSNLCSSDAPLPPAALGGRQPGAPEGPAGGPQRGRRACAAGQPRPLGRLRAGGERPALHSHRGRPVRTLACKASLPARRS